MDTNKNGLVPLAIVDLEDPITVGQETIKQLQILKRPTLGDMDGLPLNDSLDSVGIAILLGRISNVMTPNCKHITLRDMAKVMGVLSPFLPSGPAIGE